MRCLRLAVIAFGLILGLLPSGGRASEHNSPEEWVAVETTIYGNIREGIQGENRVARQEAAFKKLLNDYADNPDAQWYAFHR